MQTVPEYISASLINLVNGEIIPLVTTPTSMSESISVNANEQDILARSAPIISYVSTGARTFSLGIKVHEDALPAGYDINSFVNAIKAMCYPQYYNGVVTPPSVHLMIGSSINIIGMPQSVSVTWGNQVFRNNKVIIADIELSIKETRKSCPGLTEIRNGG